MDFFIGRFITEHYNTDGTAPERKPSKLSTPGRRQTCGDVALTRASATEVLELARTGYASSAVGAVRAWLLLDYSSVIHVHARGRRHR